MIVLNKVSKGDIKELSLYISTGEMVCIYDHERSKLRTLFNLLNRTEQVDQGTIRFLDQGSYRTDPCNDLIGFVFNEDILIPGRNIIENLKYIMKIKNLDMSCWETRLRRILEIVDLKNNYIQKTDQLMAHQVVRANIAQAILNYPPIIILEDPLSNLDQVNSQGIIHLLKRLNKFSMTVVLLSSDQHLILGKEVRVLKISNNFSEKKKGSYA